MNARYLKAAASVVLCGFILGAAASVACADTKEEIVDRMAKRLDAIKKFKAEAKIGETFDGLVDAVKASYLDDKNLKDLKKLLDDENADRKKFYALGAAQLGTTPENFALSAGKRNFREAKPEEWLKPKDGKWVQKKDLKD
jgi:uncharacterized protein YdbL (DUF1318 family)